MMGRTGERVESIRIKERRKDIESRGKKGYSIGERKEGREMVQQGKERLGKREKIDNGVCIIQ